MGKDKAVGMAGTADKAAKTGLGTAAQATGRVAATGAKL